MEGVTRNMPMFLDTLWALTVCDIEQTLYQVGNKVLKDQSVSSNTRQKRAEALQISGKCFKNVKKEVGNRFAMDKEKSDKQKRQRFEQAMFRTVAGAEGSDLDAEFEEMNL